MKNIKYIGLMIAAVLVASCGKNTPGLPGTGDGGTASNPLLDNPVTKALGDQCGIDVECKAGGIAKGNASISGVVSVDSFFQAVIDFQAKANGVSGDIEAQLAAIRGDFGIDAKADLATELKAQFDANLQGSLTVNAEPAKCEVDAQATIAATAKCDASVTPGMATVKCNGTCQLDANADVMCDASAELDCTVTAPSITCMGSCSGTCEVMLMAQAACSGTCNGSCSGNCDAYVKDGSGNLQCAGKCDGMCMGSCKAAVDASGSCMGKCEGECTTKAGAAKCDASARASCKAMGNVMAECHGRCDGDIEPPMAKAECQASAKAEAKVNVECTPPRVSIDYSLKASVSADVKAKFTAGLKNLEVRLPALLASIKKAKLVADAGTGLAADATGAVKGAVNTAASAAGAGNLRVGFGLLCALGQLDDVGMAIDDSTSRLTGDLSASAKLTGALGMK
jgi:hypothetical protein